ncbi:MAG TPA: hypothetical protein QF753_17090 [Victivallales bacterium]|nr:hypothetical protein [Victivallales bacterium]
MNNLVNSEEIFNKAIALKSENKSVCDEYRKSIVLLKLRGKSLKVIETFFHDNNIKIQGWKITSYLKKSPITDKEKSELKKYLKQ